MMNQNSLANLKSGKRFGTGQPTDRGGAPKGKRLSTLLHELGEQNIPFHDIDGIMRDMPLKKAVAVALLAKALSGDIQALKLVGSFYMASETFQPDNDSKFQLDTSTYQMLQDLGLNAEGLAQSDDVTVIFNA